MWTRRILVLLTALALVWTAGGCGTPEDESAWIPGVQPLLEAAESVEAEMSRDDFDPEVAKSLIFETREALAAYEPVDEHGAEFDQLIHDAMTYYISALKAHDKKLPGTTRQWIDQANGTVEEARQLMERYEQE
ncbi:MAG TPA: hypothetical protein VLQ52_03160 [Coriobacteriia bacterium]|nr:hypothetical protein [Coriobacteriia bacterium]